MFDEINEGTSIIKALGKNEAPDGFVVWDDGLENDYYLWLVGQGRRCIRNEISCDSIPPR